MKTSPTIIPHAPTLLAAVLLLIPATQASPEAEKVEPEFHTPKISPQSESLAKLALKRIRELMERHPDCQALKAREWVTMRMQGADAMTADGFLAATQRSAPPETATHVEKSEYQFRLATALHGIRGRAEEAEALYRRAAALAPECICYIEGLQRAVEARGDLTSSDKLNEWIYQLEEYYRSR
jgi:hypothetical protein